MRRSEHAFKVSIFSRTNCNRVKHFILSALSTPCPADKQFCVTERQVEWIGRGNQIHTSKRYCSNREYVPTGDNTGKELFSLKI